MLARRLPFLVIGIAAALTLSCGRTDSGTTPARTRDAKAAMGGLNLYIWSDYLAPHTLESFEKLTGIKVHVSYFDTNETLEARVLTGNSGYDVVVPTAPYLQRQIRSGAYLPLEKSKLPHLANLDPAFMSRVALNDPGNRYGVVYAWGTYGIGYNEAMAARALPGVPLDSWRLIFDPAYAAKLAPCGIGMLDAPAGVIRLVLRYLGRDPDVPTPRDLADAEAVLVRIRPFIRTIDSVNIIQSMANGDICLALGYNGDFVQARKRAVEARNGNKIAFMIPREGSLLWFDMLAIPRDAPHASNAHAFIDYLMRPEVIADITNSIGFANANAAASPLLDASIAADTAVYPTVEEQRRLFVQLEDSPEQSRAMTRIWQRFKTGQ